MLECSAMVACTNDDLLENPKDNPVLNGEKGYLKVKLVNTTGSAGRASDGFEEGTADENEVKKVDFFFYNNGAFFKTADETELSWTGSTGNVEKIAEAVVVLTGLTSTEYPNSVLTLVNASNELKAELNNKSLADAYKVIEETVTNGNEFVMTNSSFVPEDLEGKPVNELSTVETSTYAATVITQDDFILESSDEALENANTVNIYVERLAAKVRVGVASTANANTSNGVTLFNLGEYPVKNSATDLTTTATQTLYAKVTGWKLNATTKETNLIKKIDKKWDFVDPYHFDWNNAANYRSYWAKSTNYGDATAIYPAGFAAAVGIDGVVNPGTTDKPADDDATGAELNYINWSELTNAMGSHEYCMENTNTVEILAGKAATEDAEAVAPAFYSAVTQVVLGAQICDANGNPVTLIRYNRTLYTEDAFIARILNEVNLDITKKVVTGEGADAVTTYAKLGKADLKVVNIYDGKVTVEAKDTDADWYVGTWTGEGEDAVFTETGAYTGTTLSERLEAIDVEAEYYNNGMMHYVVPLKHLRESDNNLWTNGNIDIAEAEYGIVRNHVYDLTINKIEKLGTSVYDEKEDIIKQTIDEKTYLIAAQLNILSWKIVGQSVDL